MSSLGRRDNIDGNASSQLPTLSDLRGEISLRFTMGAKSARNEDELKHHLPLQRHHHLVSLAILLVHAFRHSSSMRPRWMSFCSAQKDSLAGSSGGSGRIDPFCQPSTTISACNSTSWLSTANFFAASSKSRYTRGLMSRVTSHALRRGYARKTWCISTAAAEQRLQWPDKLCITAACPSRLTGPIGVTPCSLRLVGRNFELSRGRGNGANLRQRLAAERTGTTASS